MGYFFLTLFITSLVAIIVLLITHTVLYLGGICG